ncbi:melatonin receptor type 1A-like [Amphiura filiformis]|uniref:melatonin receptor type 1A-like n=1 Tax=Amphiura filiformis TaxID=82378 RepID=UPI003B2166B3
MDGVQYKADNQTNELFKHNTGEASFVFHDYPQRAIVASIFIIASIVGTCGNSLVILAVILSRKLRNATNAFVVNLSCADILTSLIIPWNAVALLSRSGWPISPWVCSWAAGVLFLCVGSSLYSMALIGLNRLVLITRPKQMYNQIYNDKTLIIWIGSTWIIPFCIAIVPPLCKIGSLGYNSKYSSCSAQSTAPHTDIYDAIMALGLYPLPFVLIIISYVKIFLYVRSHTRTMTVRVSKDASNEAEKDMVVTIKDPNRSSTKDVFKKRQMQITKNMFYVVCAYFVCFTPYGLCLLIDSSDPAIPYTAALVLINGCINPFLYGTKHPMFKEVFKHMLRCNLNQIPEQSSLLRVFTGRN